MGKTRDTFRHHRWPWFGKGLYLAPVLLLLATTASIAQQSANVPVRIGESGGHARIVFDFPRITGYYVDEAKGDLVVTFDTPSTLSPPEGVSPLIEKIDIQKQDAETTKASIDLKDGVKFKHYRLMRKIIVDAYRDAPPSTPAAPTPSPAKIAETKASKAQTTTDVKKEIAPKPTPGSTTKISPTAKTAAPDSTKPDNTKLASPKDKDTTQKAVDTIKAALPVENVTVENLDTAGAAAVADAVAPDSSPDTIPTVITLSTVTPAQIAVFKRDHTLWIVLDTTNAGTVDPVVMGPDANLLGAPKTFKFDGGTAYRYALPQESDLRVEKKSLTWEVSLVGNDRLPPPKSSLLVEFDDASQKAKLMTEMKTASNVLTFEDPSVGDRLYVVPAGDESDRIDMPRRFSDVEVLPTAIGLVAKPLKDGVKLSKLENFIIINSKDGIIATPGATGGPVLVPRDREQTSDKDGRLFDFPNWGMGGMSKLNQNRRKIEQEIAEAKLPTDRVESLMKLALLYFANNFGQESIGVLRIVSDEDDSITRNPNFIALRGAANAMAGHYQDALADLSAPAIQQNPEVQLWTGYAAAASEQWRMAERSFPKDNLLLTQYPETVAIPFTIYMAESALRLGHTDTANTLLHSLDTMSEKDDPRYKAAIQYLKGEAARQEGRIDDALRLWTPVSLGIDRLYHTKASLAMTLLQASQKIIPLKTAINNLDSLRFAWRGDGLEVQVLENLGRLRIENGEYMSGLQDLDTAAKLSEKMSDDASPIRDRIAQTVTSMFTEKPSDSIPPLEAVAVYNAFGNYIPAGDDAMNAAIHLADYLTKMDLLDKAQNTLEQQLSLGVPPEKQADVGAKLAAAYLLDGKAGGALAALSRTQDAPASPEKSAERALLHARALSDMGKTEDGISALAGLSSPDSNRLRADILWHAQRWAEAAQAIENIVDTSKGTLDEDNARLVINAAVAYKLAGDKDGLNKLRARFEEAMTPTSQNAVFGVITRNSGTTDISDRDTILKMAGEVDMFKNFLDGYRGKGS